MALPFPFLDTLQGNPVIAAAKNDEGLEHALRSDCMAVFLLYGNICSVSSLTERVASAGKNVYVHADLIDGLSAKDISVDYLCRTTKAAGIISTKPSLIRYAQSLGLCTIQRFFVIDSMALENLKRQLEHTRPDVIEVLPGVMPKIIQKINGFTRIPLIAGGLISDKEDIITALDNGASAVSTTNPKLWFV